MLSIVVKIGLIIFYGNSRAVDAVVVSETVKRVHVKAHFGGCSYSSAASATGRKVAEK